jgi:hypothetical protein
MTALPCGVQYSTINRDSICGWCGQPKALHDKPPSDLRYENLLQLVKNLILTYHTSSNQEDVLTALTELEEYILKDDTTS